MAKKIKLDWKKFEIAKVTCGDLALLTPVKVDGMLCKIGDYLIKAQGGRMMVVTPEEIEAIIWLDPSEPEEVPELEVE